MTIPNFDPWADVLVAEIEGQKIRAPQYGVMGRAPLTHEEWLALKFTRGAGVLYKPVTVVKAIFP